MPSLTKLLAEKRILLADGATGTNYFDRGLTAGDPPELWNADNVDRVAKLHMEFVVAGADIILTNTFGCNKHRLKLHQLQSRVHELNKRAAQIARKVADASGRDVIVAGSVGPTGELFEPMGTLTFDDAVACFKEQVEGLKAGGADVAWIETMSSPDEMRAAMEGAIRADLPYTYTGSFDTAGRTMMGLEPEALGAVADGMTPPPIAHGSNCGVGASDLLLSVLSMTETNPDAVVIAKGNCGVPQVKGGEVVYSGTPELMARYVRLAVDSGARIIGGCCGTTPEHLAAMRKALDTHTKGDRPTRAKLEADIGPLVNPPVSAADRAARKRVSARG